MTKDIGTDPTLVGALLSLHLRGIVLKKTYSHGRISNARNAICTSPFAPAFPKRQLMPTRSAVYYQGQGKRTQTKMTLFFVCIQCVRSLCMSTSSRFRTTHSCDHAFQDPKLAEKRARGGDEAGIQPQMEEL